ANPALLAPTRQPWGRGGIGGVDRGRCNHRLWCQVLDQAIFRLMVREDGERSNCFFRWGEWASVPEQRQHEAAQVARLVRPEVAAVVADWLQCQVPLVLPQLRVERQLLRRHVRRLEAEAAGRARLLPVIRRPEEGR